MQQLRPYSQAIEEQMQCYYQSLSEKDRRRYAAIEAVKLGHGGISYINRVLGCSRNSIRLGLAELSDPTAMSDRRQREPGGGRKSAFDTIEGLDEAFVRVIECHTAGSPMDDSLKWTHLTRQQIADLLATEADIHISVTVVDQLLKKHQFRRRQALKRKAAGSHPRRNEQFEVIAQRVETYQAAGAPVISMDTKKRNG